MAKNRSGKRQVIFKAPGLSRTIDTRSIRSTLGKSLPLISLEPIIFNVHPGRRQYLILIAVSIFRGLFSLYQTEPGVGALWTKTQSGNPQ